MGRTAITLEVVNLADEIMADRGKMAVSGIRRAIVDNVLVDTGATFLCLHRRIIRQLGLAKVGTVQLKTANGPVRRNRYEEVRIYFRVRRRDVRHASTPVIEHPADVPQLLGVVPIETMDLLVDARSKQLIPNPAHGGKFMVAVYPALSQNAPPAEVQH